MLKVFHFVTQLLHYTKQARTEAIVIVGGI